MQKIPVSARWAQLDDSQRETAILFAHRALVAACCRRDQIAAWKVLRRLIRSRSREAISRLERERGLVKLS